MATKAPIIYPIGVQDFENLRRRNNVYVDKTDLIYRLVSTNTVYFLSRPRRFGKSLLISTLEAYFRGKRELFEGLAIAALEEEWGVYPVLHIDFSMRKYLTADALHELLDYNLLQWEKVYGREEGETSYATRFEGIIRRAYEQTGQQVVILIDEYDSPMLDTNNNLALQAELRGMVRDFFSVLKGTGRYQRFLFMTGISKFSQLSIFSELNNLQNISLREEYAALCGITEEELLTQLQPGIQALADRNGESYDEACAHLKRRYDGYHFSEQSPDIYNPFSLLNTLAAKKYGNYWFSSGTPTFLMELIGRMQFDVTLMEEVSLSDEEFDRATDIITDPIPVLYQSGYITIKGYHPQLKLYTLAYPNEEVRLGFIKCLLPTFVHRSMEQNSFYIINFVQDMLRGDINGCLERTRAFFASIPNDLENKTEKHYQTVFYLMFRLMGQYIDTEVKSAIGRADVVMKTAQTIYVFEFKLDGTARQAMDQINSQGYAIPYMPDHRKVVKVGISFDIATRTLGEWMIEEVELSGTKS